MKSYPNNDSSSETFSGGKFGGVTIAFSAIATAVNTALTEAAIDPWQMSIGVTLNRKVNGKSTTRVILPKQAIKPFIFAGSLKSGLFGYWSPANTGNNGYTIRTAAAVAAAEVGEKYAYIPFGAPVDCTGENGGSITVEVTTRNLFGATTNTTTSVAVVDLKEIEGAESFVPMLSATVIPTGQNQLGMSFDGIVRRLTVVNFDKTSLLTAEQVVQSVDLKTNEMSYSYDDKQLIMFNVESYSNLTDGENALQNFDFIPFNYSKAYTDVSINLGLQSADVAASQNFVVCWGGVPTVGSELQFRRSQAIVAAKANELQQTATL